jgi:tRNA-Thr(GGU) m(6)t(6)A37 methyltransferase TsaA
VDGLGFICKLYIAFDTMSANGDSPLTGALLAAFSLCLWQYYQSVQNVSKFERAYWGERRGRARVEQEMKRISNIQLNTDEGFFVQPIGEIHSCYRQCVGTPRQGLLAPASRATIKLNSHISPESLVGLENFSHVWITFKFHLNTNTLKESKSFSSRSTFNAKITLPMLKKKQGVFATRSPHRPNPVGVTLAKIDRIDKRTRTVYLQGCDLVEGTPVLDVKVRTERRLLPSFSPPLSNQLHTLFHIVLQPYVPAYDTVPEAEGRIPEWIQETVHTRNTVTVLPACLDYVRSIKGRLVQYKDAPEEFMKGECWDESQCICLVVIDILLLLLTCPSQAWWRRWRRRCAPSSRPLGA